MLFLPCNCRKMAYHEVSVGILYRSQLEKRLTLICSVLVAVFFAGISLAQTQSSSGDSSESSVTRPSTRAEVLRQQREEKRGDLEPPKQELIEKYLKKIERKGNQSIEDTNFWGFHPRIDWIARNSGAAAGVRFWRPDTWGFLDLLGSAFYSWKRYQHYDAQIGALPNRGSRIPSRNFEREALDQLGDIDRSLLSRFKLYASGRYRDQTERAFYGTGPDTNLEDQVFYRIKDSLGEAVTGYQFSQNLGVNFKIGGLFHSLGDARISPTLSDRFPDVELPGKVKPPNFLRLHTSVLYDRRDNPGVPHRGFMIAFGWEKYDNVNARNLFNFNRFMLDTRGFIPLGWKQQVIALRGFFVNSDPAPGNRVPFFLQPSLGGGESLRAYESFRFQGDKLMLLQGEYRWEPSRILELALFVDSGTVANQGQRISLEKLKSNGGIGFRVKSSRGTLFRIDQAWGSEGAKTQFRFSAVF